MNRFISSLFIILSLSSCYDRSNKTPPAPLKQINTKQYIDHTVKYFGETLGLIAAWYTGKGSNWTAIREANPGIKPERIRIGQTIKIPKELITKEESFPEGYVRRFAVAEPAAQNEELINELISATPEPAANPNPTASTQQPEQTKTIPPVVTPEPAPTKEDVEREKMLDELLQ
jgi:hypothetical protein